MAVVTLMNGRASCLKILLCCIMNPLTLMLNISQKPLSVFVFQGIWPSTSSLGVGWWVLKVCQVAGKVKNLSSYVLWSSHCHSKLKGKAKCNNNNVDWKVIVMGVCLLLPEI